MNPFLKKLEHEAIESAIAAAELRTSGELRVIIQAGKVADARAAAAQAFAKHGMHRTEARNGVLILLAPKSRCFAIHADEAIFKACGQEFWTVTAGAMEHHFKEGRFTEGIVAGISAAGGELARHFPRQADDRNELPNTVIDEG